MICNIVSCNTPLINKGGMLHYKNVTLLHPNITHRRHSWVLQDVTEMLQNHVTTMLHE